MEGLTWLERLGRRVPLYIQIKRGWLSVTDLSRGTAFETHTRVAYVPGTKRFEPCLVTDADLAALRREWGDRLQIGDGFSHPRAPIGNPQFAEVALQIAVDHVLASRWQKPSRVILHLQDKWTGGYTEVEVRAMRDLAIMIGAAHVGFLMVAESLTSQDVLALLNGTYSGPAQLRR
ncbi:MAG: hypothetical protein AAFP18_09185 [Bacteroidota bacterium]